MPILPVVEQETFYKQLDTEYKATLARYAALGENPLEAKSLDLNARTLGDVELVSQQEESQSVFAQGIRAEVVRNTNERYLGQSFWKHKMTASNVKLDSSYRRKAGLYRRNRQHRNRSQPLRVSNETLSTQTEGSFSAIMVVDHCGWETILPSSDEMQVFSMRVIGVGWSVHMFNSSVAIRRMF